MAYGENEYGLLYKGEQPPDEVELSGARVFRWRPDWRDPVELRYSASTIIAESMEHVEQRRAQYAALKRMMSFTVADDEYLPEVENFIRRWHSSVIWMPVWSERMVVTTAALIGLDVIDVEATADRFSLNEYADYVCLIDQDGVLDPEVFSVESVAATSITVAAAVVGAYTSANAMLYPAVRMIQDGNSLSDLTAHYGRYALTWKEWF